jgi:hypothetical protein
MDGDGLSGEERRVWAALISCLATERLVRP